MVPRPHLPLRVLLHLGRLLAYVLSVRRTHHTPARKTPPDLSSGAKQVAQEQTRGKRRAMGSSSTRAPASPRCRLPALSAPSGARARVPTSAPTHPLPHGRHGYRHVSATTVKRRDVVLLSFCLVSFPDFVSLAILPIASSCCTEVSHHISRRLLERVNICRIQKADGDCDLAAVILHVKRRRICVSPHNHVMKRWMKEQAAKKNAKGSICHKRQHHSKGSSKGAQQEKQKVHGHKTPY
ncbi:C-C motif chemokine 28 isoform X1 [Manis javanica]|uniref:C-C motif chemokine 28 isoform X1 n=1 Tax=Manis javanica TaxID=9974 RepID=UPI000812EDE5